MFYAADDDDTATVVAQVINDGGFDAPRYAPAPSTAPRSVIRNPG